MTKLVLALFLTLSPAVAAAQDPDPVPPPDSAAAPQDTLGGARPTESPVSFPRWDRRIEDFADDVSSGRDTPGQGRRCTTLSTQQSSCHGTVSPTLCAAGRCRRRPGGTPR